MKNLSKYLSFCLAAILMLALSLTVFADGPEPDLSRHGSISVTIHEFNTGNAVPGGKMACLRVANLVYEGGQYKFKYTDEFAGCGYPLENLNSAELAANLNTYARETGLAGAERSSQADGSFKFEDLTLGIYLIYQIEKAQSYSAVNPFLVSVPMNDGTTCTYDVDASPKPGTVTGPPTPPPTPTPSLPPRLPQTGQLWWPVPVLAVSGILFIALGIALKKYGENE